MFIPPPITAPYQYKNCQQINLEGKRLYLTPDGDKTPSVTTILSSTKDNSFLVEWRKRVGEQNAKDITTEASGRGTSMHRNIENFILNKPRVPGNNLVHVHANKMADIIIQEAFPKISEVWGMEQSLYFPGLYSGTTDLIAVYDNNPSICDYKQSNKVKKEEHVEDYYLQLMAYLMCHNEVYKTDIKEGHIFMCTKDLKYLQFDLLPKDFNKYQDMWLLRVEEYYTKHHN